MTSQMRSICSLPHSIGTMPGKRVGIQGEQSPLTEGWVPQALLSVKMHPASQTTAQEVPLPHVFCLQITVNSLMYPALLNQQAPLLYGCRRLLANGKIVLEQQVKAAINCGWKGWSPWRCWLIKQLETTSHYLHSHKAELDWHPSKWLSFHQFKPFVQFGFSRDKPRPLGSPQTFLPALNKASTGSNTFNHWCILPMEPVLPLSLPGAQQTRQQWYKCVCRCGYLGSKQGAGQDFLGSLN